MSTATKKNEGFTTEEKAAMRARAKELRGLAANAHEPQVRVHLLELAASYERIAKMAELGASGPEKSKR